MKLVSTKLFELGFEPNGNRFVRRLPHFSQVIFFLKSGHSNAYFLQIIFMLDEIADFPNRRECGDANTRLGLLSRQRGLFEVDRALGLDLDLCESERLRIVAAAMDLLESFVERLKNVDALKNAVTEYSVDSVKSELGYVVPAAFQYLGLEAPRVPET